jgi:hypothetical protein
MAGQHRAGTATMPAAQLIALCRAERAGAQVTAVSGPISDRERPAAAAGLVDVNPERGVEPAPDVDRDTYSGSPLGRWFRAVRPHAAT